jgi:hypothetical protein
MFQIAFRRLKHAFVLFEDVLLYDIDIVLRFGIRVRAARHDGNTHNQKKVFFH